MKQDQHFNIEQGLLLCRSLKIGFETLILSQPLELFVINLFADQLQSIGHFFLLMVKVARKEK